MQNELKRVGYQIINEVYSIEEINTILKILERKEFEKKFGVREFLMKNPELIDLIFTNNLQKIINSISENAKPIKSLYFDKPPNTNWIVNWHQDLTINVEGKVEDTNFKNWRVLKERTIVQPSREILDNIFTIRIHLDDCTKENGALKIIEGSHNKGVIQIKNWIKKKEGKEKYCEVKKGGILVMKPLILHSSKRVENNKNRRIIHIEFCEKRLPDGLSWKETLKIKKPMPNNV